jgi:hypothetical protein
MEHREEDPTGTREVASSGTTEQQGAEAASRAEQEPAASRTEQEPAAATPAAGIAAPSARPDTADGEQPRSGDAGTEGEAGTEAGTDTPAGTRAPAEGDGALLPRDEDAEFHRRWEDIQTRFVDEPRGAVEEADVLVATVMKRLAEGFAQERERLEAQWGRGEDISTEDLRVALQHYRAFFRRLLSA